MKSSLIAVCCLLVGCSVDSDPEPPKTEIVVPIKTPPPKHPDDVDESSSVKCVVEAYWVNNCYVVKTYCQGESPRVDISCDHGRPLWPWEYIPDPPYGK